MTEVRTYTFKNGPKVYERPPSAGELVQGLMLLDEIKKAAAVETKLRRLNAQDRNLSVKGALAEAKRQGADDAEATLVLKQLEGGPEGHLLAPAFRRLSMGIKNFARTS